MPKKKPASVDEIPFIDPEEAQNAQADLVDGVTATHLARTFQALADPTRVRIISALARTELCVYDLATLLDITHSAVSHQLRILRDLRLVRSRRAGRLVYYALDDDHIDDLFHRGLEHVEHG